jgi:hypothetical protein
MFFRLFFIARACLYQDWLTANKLSRTAICGVAPKFGMALSLVGILSDIKDVSAGIKTRPSCLWFFFSL